MLGGAELVEASSDGEPGDKSRFVRGVERVLLAGGAELGVHSAKDLPGDMPEELEIAAVPVREDPARRTAHRRRSRLHRHPEPVAGVTFNGDDVQAR
jgi:porphobilinogen deaminase